MSKYEPLWKWIRDNGTASFKLTYAEIEEIAGYPRIEVIMELSPSVIASDR